jgi:hypothetical protein
MHVPSMSMNKNALYFVDSRELGSSENPDANVRAADIYRGSCSWEKKALYYAIVPS